MHTCKETGEELEDQEDWIIDANDFYIATRSLLIRRGFCCANQCRNCPYINWRTSPTWEPLPAAAVLYTDVPPKAIEGVRKALGYHERQREQMSQTEEAYHQAMIAHYRLLLERWEAIVETREQQPPRSGDGEHA